ncbi:MAG: leucine--tRNA ligase [Candidatus Bathyarchaeota archaeon]|uniref:leucine--tRNA ligase n=1 Tax=Candidatus Bathycorpusculum sp. TaxID=2994959 RepID=UPI00282C2088|nr:leucine--tRNA ligase [Candidatus Termiticorpusculum sp.]MCL2257924.1 leucine--tRNA ligase [Candidatus Termiticorpusculum sp.]MCL2291927.1 leucine--tRNA ligase [Candidatus Termiticorpusculum sp.]
MSQTTTTQIEEKWLAKWETAHIFEADPDPVKQKIMVTFPFPYMNGPLHVGHAFSASRVDAYARFKRMQGYNVLWPWAWHWTGQPLLGASQRIAKGDQPYIRVLREVDGVPEEHLQKFVDPKYMAQYYTNEGKIAAKRIGFSVDWRREFTTVWPTFQKFIEWQYKNLKDQGYVTQGTHPVVWCPKDQSPTGDHDRQSGEGVTPEEYTLIKYKLDNNTVLPAATFRPETIYGITNIWINPDATYVEAKINNNNENWIISQEAAEKLEEQEKSITIKRVFKGRELLGKNFENPLTHDKFPILPGWFVDPKTATGIVYSVPAHAPFDWLALKDLQQKPEILQELGIDPQIVQQIKPISIIKVDGFGEYPAVEIVEQMGIKDQHDSKADQATKELYKKEFHNGKLKVNCGPYAGKSIRGVKDQLIIDFKKLDIADTMYDLPEQVICRCMTHCVVKILSDQWFLNYSNPQWKEKAKEVIAQMKIYPETVRTDFYAKIDWLKEWACARTTGFGTPVPWSEGWIIETLSDSTMYMAFYTINKHINQNNIPPQALTPEVFDYIYHGKGDKIQISKTTNITIELLEAMHEEFLYWYPFDLRNSAKELVPNHLSFCIFHHAALFPPQHWPKGIGVNGMLMVEGQGMHKSKGNFITLKGAIDKYGADATRCGLMLGAEGMDDPDWRADNVEELKNKFEALTNFVSNIFMDSRQSENTFLERWLQNRLQYRILEVTESLQELKTRTALQIALFEVWNDLRWYKQRKGSNVNTVVLFEAVKTWIKMLTPFAPYMCEELWSQTGETGFISVVSWPQFDENKIDVEAEEQENLITDILNDTQNILKATKITPKQLVFYTAAAWKWQIYLKILEKTKTGEAKISELMKDFSNNPELKPHIKDIAILVPKIIKTTNRLSLNRKTNMLKIQKIDEKTVMQNALDFLKDRFGAEVTIYSEEDQNRYDPKTRASTAMPYQPAIYIQ